MKVIIPDEQMSTGKSNLNYKAKRKMRLDAQRRTGMQITREEFENYLLFQRLKRGDVEERDIKKMAASGLAHYDNVEQFPDGTLVKLNAENIAKRNKEDLTHEFLSWVEENKDKEFHLVREENKQSLVCLEEDVRTKELDGKEVTAPKWLFDLMSDLLVKNNEGNWVEPWTIEGSMGEYVDLADATEEIAAKELEKLDAATEEGIAE